MKINVHIWSVIAWVIFLAVWLGGTMNAAAVTSPASLFVKVFEMRVSTSSDCSRSVTVFKTAFPDSVDLLTNPTLGSGAVNDGTYHCLMYHVSDKITVTPLVNDPPGCDPAVPPCGCVVGTQYNLDFFATAPTASVSPDGAPIAATGGEDQPWIYFSDSAQSASVNNCFQPTEVCACAAPCPLPGPLALSQDQTHILVMNFNGQLDGSSGTSCVLIPAVIGFTPVPAFSIR